MTFAERLAADKPQHVFGKTATLSTEGHTNIYRRFAWPERLPEDAAWLSDDLSSIHGTRFATEWPADVRRRLGRAEAVNFYSLNIHGERELIGEVIKRLHTSDFRAVSEFFHHFIEEENAHIWFFAKFCLDYAGKIYPDRRVYVAKESASREIGRFVVLAKILIFEELVDYFNRRLADDPSLPAVVRDINQVHHTEESRHIACSRELVAAAYGDVRDTTGEADRIALEGYLRGYMRVCLESLYNPTAYADAAVPIDPYQLRRELLEHPARAAKHADIMRRTLLFFTKLGAFNPPEVTS